MHESCQKFVAQMAPLSEGIRSRIQEKIDYFAPDEPPITVIFESIGDQIAENFDNTSSELNRQIFHLIETAIDSGDINLVTAVATGLIEAIATKTVHKTGLWQRIAPMLGARTLQHANAWLA